MKKLKYIYCIHIDYNNGNRGDSYPYTSLIKMILKLYKIIRNWRGNKLICYVTVDAK